MEEVPGAFGSSASFALRLGQTVFSSASLFFMCFGVDFYTYTAFCYLVTVMGLVIPWNLTLLVVDAYSVFIKCLPIQRRLIMIILLGDMVLSYLSLAAACSTASVADILLEASEFPCPAKICVNNAIAALSMQGKILKVYFLILNCFLLFYPLQHSSQFFAAFFLQQQVKNPNIFYR